MARLRHDDSGTSFIEFTVVFPLTVLVVLGTVDLSLLLFDWASATKATYAGARTATLSDPVARATRFTLASYGSQSTYSGRYCFDPATGDPDPKANCPSFSVQCTGDDTAAGGSCSSGTFNKASFDAILASVRQSYPFRAIDRSQLRVSYATTNLGFVGQQNFAGGSGELPMNVSVELRCITHDFYFVGPLLAWAPAVLPQDCDDTAAADAAGRAGLVMPPFYTTLPSEDLASN